MVKIAKVGESCEKMMKMGVKWGIRDGKRGKSGGKWWKVEKWSGGWKKSACSNPRFSTLKSCFLVFFQGGEKPFICNGFKTS